MNDPTRPWLLPLPILLPSTSLRSLLRPSLKRSLCQNPRLRFYIQGIWTNPVYSRRVCVCVCERGNVKMEIGLSESAEHFPGTTWKGLGERLAQGRGPEGGGRGGPGRPGERRLAVRLEGWRVQSTKERRSGGLKPGTAPQPGGGTVPTFRWKALKPRL